MKFFLEEYGKLYINNPLKEGVVFAISPENRGFGVRQQSLLEYAFCDIFLL